LPGKIEKTHAASVFISAVHG